uniref:Uncharacterized protein n=1 Tax=Anopheles coluzzii TaxID=1518534 RepID=A0A8W7PQP1_ANOCL
MTQNTISLYRYTLAAEIAAYNGGTIRAEKSAHMAAAAAAATAHRIRPDTQHADGTGNVTVSWVMSILEGSGHNVDVRRHQRDMEVLLPLPKADSLRSVCFKTASRASRLGPDGI